MSELLLELKKTKMASKNKVEKGILSLVVGTIETNLKNPKTKFSLNKYSLSDICAKIKNANDEVVASCKDEAVLVKLLEENRILDTYIILQASNDEVVAEIDALASSGVSTLGDYFSSLKIKFPNGFDSAFAKKEILAKIQ